MRIGTNPAKKSNVTADGFFHQIIIPVYIPNLEGYFKDSLSILKICLESLNKTSVKGTFITIVNNGSCLTVVNYLNKLFENKFIHEVIHTSNIGKNRAIAKGVQGHNFEIITISDSDVLFTNNWQKETYKIFNNFPKVAVVGLVPQFSLYKSYSSNLLFDNFFSKKLRFKSLKNVSAIKMFYNSTWFNFNYNDYHLKYILTLKSKKNKITAVVGSGHFVATYLRDAIRTDFNEGTYKGLSSKLDRDSLDIPCLKLDMWRLTTYDNYAYHLGNISEEWMYDKLNSLSNESDSEVKFKRIKKKIKNKKLSYLIKSRFFKKIFKIKFFMHYFYKLKGLPNEAVYKY